MTEKKIQRQIKFVTLIIILPIVTIAIFLSASAAEKPNQEFWSVFLIEEDEVTGAVAISGNKVARQGFDFPAAHLVIIDLLDGSTRHYDQEEYVAGIYWIDMDGDWVVTHNRNAPQYPDTIQAINLITDEHVEVFPYPGYFIENDKPAIDGNSIVWMQNRQCCGWDLMHFDLETRTTISITTDGSANTEHWPDVSGDWVVWNNGSFQNGDIHAYNMATTEHVTVTQDSYAQWYPKIDGNLLTWTDSRAGPTSRDIYGFDMETRQEFPLVVGPQPAYAQDVDGNILTWYESINGPASQIFGRNLDTGETTLIYETIPPSMPYGPTFLSGNIVLWVFSEAGDYNAHLYGARRLTYQSYLPITAK